MTLKEARKNFRDYVAPNIPKHDRPALDEAWGIYIDSLCKDGTITDKQYNTWTRT